MRFQSVIFVLVGLSCIVYAAPLTDLKQEPRFVPKGWPVEGRVSSQFGVRRHPIRRHHHFHKGIDIASPPKTPVHATASGRIKSTGFEPGYGRLVVVDHGHGWESLYGHLHSSSVSVNAVVAAGSVIGRSGKSGRVTGPHLHYEVRYLGSPQDPLHFINGSNRRAPSQLAGSFQTSSSHPH